MTLRKRENDVERLTKKNDYKKTTTLWKYRLKCKFYNNLAIQRLGRYEDTGVTPEQILEIDKLYREKCEEVAKYEKYIGQISSTTPLEYLKGKGIDEAGRL